MQPFQTMTMPFKDTHDTSGVVRTLRVDAPFDFRSARFAEDARRLVAHTGRSLESCRQELFLAEGDVDEARAVLDRGDRPYSGHGPLQ